MMDATTGAIVAALISGLCVAVPTIVATITSNKAHDQVVDEKMKNMTEQVKDIDTKLDRYASNVDILKERLVVVEQSTKSAHHRLDDIAQQLNIHERRGEK